MIALLAALYVWGIPALARVVAARIPAAWEEGLGAAAVDLVAPPGKRCTDAPRMRAIEEIVGALAAPLPPPPYRFRVIVLDDRAVNALAAPGGYVVLFRGLLEQTRTAEELAGVLAHELQHILQRHTTRALLQHASIGLLVAVLVGDANRAMAYGLESARILGTLQYSRQTEEEADTAGIRMILDAGIDPAGMIRFFETLAQEGGDFPGPLKYLSTHPGTVDRIRKLKALAAQASPPRAKLLPDHDWRDIRKICQDRPAGAVGRARPVS